MMDADEWGRDPSVRAMRKVFKGMEHSLEQILGKLGISPNDPRIRKWLENALEKFEQSCGVANQLGVTMDEKIAPLVYARCLTAVIGSEGIEIPQGILPEETETERWIREVFK